MRGRLHAVALLAALVASVLGIDPDVRVPLLHTHVLAAWVPSVRCSAAAPFAALAGVLSSTPLHCPFSFRTGRGSPG